ncbi:MAG: methylated-DNA--[protein]-cysteine S-methyltransferase [Thioalkalivibrio sp.]
MSPDAVISSPVGRLGIRCRDGALTALTYLSDTEPLRAPTGLAAEVADQLDQYFSEPDFRFELPLGLDGTTFQRRVWSALADIPRGELRSYGELARELQTGPRAVGGACARNPIIIVVPCHRVVPVTGGLGGYGGSGSGAGVDVKAWLVRHECARLHGRSAIS